MDAKAAENRFPIQRNLVTQLYEMVATKRRQDFIGYDQIAAELAGALRSLQTGETVELHLADRDVPVLTCDAIRLALLEAAEDRTLRLRVLLFLNGDGKDASGLCTAFLPLLLADRLKLFSVSSPAELHSHAVLLLVRGRFAFQITQLAGAMPTAQRITDGDALIRLSHLFSQTGRLAIPYRASYGAFIRAVNEKVKN